MESPIENTTSPAAEAEVKEEKKDPKETKKE